MAIEEMDLFPFTASADEDISNLEYLPLFKEIAWDFIENKPVIDINTHEFVIVEGIEALKVWIYKTLLTERYAYEIYSDDYGNEVTRLVGKGYTRGYSESEATRFDKESLMVNRYIYDVRKKEARFYDSTLDVTLIIDSVYGEVNINVRGYDSRISTRGDA